MSEADHKRCLTCGYILDGLPEPRCPECGREFDPSDSKTYILPGVSTGHPWLYPVAALFGVAVNGAPFFVTYVDRPAFDLFDVAGFAFQTCVLITTIRALRISARGQAFLIAAALISALGLVGCLGLTMIYCWQE